MPGEKCYRTPIQLKSNVKMGFQNYALSNLNHVRACGFTKIKNFCNFYWLPLKPWKESNIG